MQIERVKRLRGCGVFRDFTWPTDLPDFGRFNLIYGWNGSGKTTLSRLLRCLETRAATLDGDCTITVAGSDFTRATFHQVTMPIRVFNREFVAESVFPTAGEVAPILVLGKENVDKQKQVDRMKVELATAQDNLRVRRTAKSTADTQLDNYCIENARLIKEVLRSSGTNRYNNFNKADYRIRAQELLSATDGASHVLADAERDSLRRQLQTSPKATIEKIQQLDFDEAKKLRIIRFLHTHSHGDVVGEPEHDLSLLSESQAILSDLLGLMKSQDGDHFKAMESLLATATSEDQ